MRTTIALLALSWCAFGAAQRLTLLPQPNDSLQCTPIAISRNNEVIIGSYRDRYNEYGIYWRNGQLHYLPGIPTAVSADGSRIAMPGGYWENGNLVSIYPQNPNRTVRPVAMTPDGRVIIGNIQADPGVLMFRWEQGVGLDVHRRTGGPRWLRPDGQRIYAGGNFPVYADDLCSFETLVERGAPFGMIMAVSDDERWMLTRENSDSWVWDSEENVVYYIEPWANAMRALGNAMSQDGVVYGFLQLSFADARAFRWTPGGGVQDLNDLYGCALPDGWFYWDVRTVSHDGRYLAGVLRREGGSEYRPFLLDTQAGANGDVNGDGCVDDADLLMVLFNFGQRGRGLHADVNCDGIVDDADLLIVLFNFGTGC
ncbi:MAG: dockerin type I domain-containing protein [Fimbriimonadales bacterium]